jgi:hypothetical protein
MLLHVLELKTTQNYQRMNLHPPSTNLNVQVVREGQKHYAKEQQNEFRNLPYNLRQFGLMFTLTTFESIGMIEFSNFQ